MALVDGKHVVSRPTVDRASTPVLSHNREYFSLSCEWEGKRFADNTALTHGLHARMVTDVNALRLKLWSCTLGLCTTMVERTFLYLYRLSNSAHFLSIFNLLVLKRMQSYDVIHRLRSCRICHVSFHPLDVLPRLVAAINLCFLFHIV